MVLLLIVKLDPYAQLAMPPPPVLAVLPEIVLLVIMT
jgi:hypothetical protein